MKTLRIAVTWTLFGLLLGWAGAAGIYRFRMPTGQQISLARQASPEFRPLFEYALRHLSGIDGLTRVDTPSGPVNPVNVVVGLPGDDLAQDARVIAILKERGVDLNLPDSHPHLGFSPLHRALMSERTLALASELIRLGADVNVRARGDRFPGYTPLRLARHVRKLALNQLRAERAPASADAPKRGAEAAPPLPPDAWQERAVQLLLQHGAKE
jgi:hypothetical protein